MQSLTKHCDPQDHHPANPNRPLARICAVDYVHLVRKAPLSSTFVPQIMSLSIRIVIKHKGPYKRTNLITKPLGETSISAKIQSCRNT